MKKIFHVSTALFISLGTLHAQITINADDIDPIGVVAFQTTDFAPDASIQPGGTGMQTWDFTALKDSVTNKFTFVDPASTPHASLFPQANLAAVLGDTFLYFLKDNQKLQALGSYGTFSYEGFPITAKLELNPAQTIIQFPANFGGGYSETSRQNITVANFVPGAPFDSLRAVTITDRVIEIDAFGTLTTSLGTFDVLRFTETDIVVDSTFGYSESTMIWTPIADNGPDTLVNYNWWTNENDLAFPIVQYQLDLSDNEARVLWLKDFVSSTRAAVPALQISLRPNPTAGQLFVQLEENLEGSLEVYDFNGRLVKTLPIQSDFIEINLQGQAAGTYLLVAKSSKGALKGFQRFEVID
jgi:hypothetical protein